MKSIGRSSSLSAIVAGSVFLSSAPPSFASEPTTTESSPVFEVRADSTRSVRVTLQRASSVSARETTDGKHYRNTFPHADVIVRRVPEGVEDLTVFRARPVEEVLRYSVELNGLAGLRMVEGSRTLELLDYEGAPRIRMNPPWWRSGLATDSRTLGREQPVDVRVVDCTVDTSPMPPWQRPVVSPGHRTCTVELRWHSPSYPIVVDPVWVTTGNLVHARANHIAEGIDGDRVLVAGGVGNLGDNEASISAEIWDSATGTWAMSGAMSMRREEAASVQLVDGRVLVVGGGGSSSLSRGDVFDPATGSWTAVGGTMDPLTYHTATLLQAGRVLVVGGGVNTYDNATDACFVFDPGTDTFAPAAPLPAPRTGHAAVRLEDGRVLVLAGMGEGPAPVDGFAAVYDPAEDTWTDAPVHAYPRWRGSALRLPKGDVLLAGGGTNNFSGEARTEVFDIDDETWTPGPNMPLPTIQHAVVGWDDGRIAFLGGWSDMVSRLRGSLYAWSEEGGTWSELSPMTVPRLWFTATMLDDGRVLVAGGRNPTADKEGSVELLSLAGMGEPCDSWGTCQSRHCVDEVCCDQPCTEVCTACRKDLVGEGGQDGICAAVGAGTDPKEDCSAEPPCGTTGVCDGTGACALEEQGVSCAETTCVQGLLSTSVCDGLGSCVSQQTTCDGNLACLASDATCPTACASALDCLAGYRCVDGACVAKLAQGEGCGSASEACRDGLVCMDGICCDTGGEDDCGLFRCAEGGTCLTECASTADCTPGARCDGQGRCTVQAAATLDDGGCGCRLAAGRGRREAVWSWLAGLVAVLGTRRRARRERNGRRLR